MILAKNHQTNETVPTIRVRNTPVLVDAVLEPRFTPVVFARRRLFALYEQQIQKPLHGIEHIFSFRRTRAMQNAQPLPTLEGAVFENVFKNNLRAQRQPFPKLGRVAVMV